MNYLASIFSAYPLICTQRHIARCYWIAASRMQREHVYVKLQASHSRAFYKHVHLACDSRARCLLHAHIMRCSRWGSLIFRRASSPYARKGFPKGASFAEAKMPQTPIAWKMFARHTSLAIRYGYTRCLNGHFRVDGMSKVRAICCWKALILTILMYCVKKITSRTGHDKILKWNSSEDTAGNCVTL